MEKVSVICTVLNEESTLPSLLGALEKQSLRPDEVVIVDGGSHDSTVEILKSWHPPFPCRLAVKRGNRSVGRNEAIRIAKGNVIAITDAGCMPHKNWLKNIVQPILDEGADVSAGYYQARAKTPFEMAASAYMLVMPEKVDPEDFLPATRSMALTRQIWTRVHGFDPALSHNEDYAFAHRLRGAGARIVFVRQAVVDWNPPKTWAAFLKQIGRFAYGDVSAGIWRPKVISIFIRWLFLLGVLLLNPIFFVACLTVYCGWAYAKNRKYVPGAAAVRILPLMQVSTDWVVIAASMLALVNKQ